MISDMRSRQLAAALFFCWSFTALSVVLAMLGYTLVLWVFVPVWSAWREK